MRVKPGTPRDDINAGPERTALPSEGPTDTQGTGRLKLWSHQMSGRRVLIRTEPDTPRGRESIDRSALALMSSPRVLWCRVERRAK